jgi:predicted O-methyltransferase YrrM
VVTNVNALPQVWWQIRAKSDALGFDMPSDIDTGAMLRLLAASKPGGRLLELGTGTGLSTACLLAGMDAEAHLVSVDNDARVQAIAREFLGHDSRVTFKWGDGLDYIRRAGPRSVDLIFADAWPGKYDGIDIALALLRPGGLYVVDDMLPQPNWPENHQPRVDALSSALTSADGLTATFMTWSSGLVIAACTPVTS